MADGPIDFKALADEAAKGVYNPRARRCWPWTHEWTMWELDGSSMAQERRCVGCGRVQRNVIAKTCEHSWLTTREGEVVMQGCDIPIGYYFDQKCFKCGDVRRRELRNTRP